VYRVITATLIAFSVFASTPEQRVSLPGLAAPVEILRDRWGVPHIYAGNVTDLFFAQGYMTARDRLWQIDLWRRTGTGKLAEILGPAAIARDRLARLVRYRGNPEEEWRSYGPNTREIVTAFVSGINAYILSLQGRWPAEFQIGGYSPGLWVPEDCLSRVAGLLMTRNLTREVSRVADVKRFGLQRVAQYLPPDPQVPLELPKGLDLADISGEILRAYNEAVGAVRFPAQGSNNWVVDGSMTVTGKPILANDPHRPIQIPSLRKTFHLVAPGWNVFGAGEPALPGVALGHNESIGFGFTIVGIDQQDLYVEKLNPANSNEYFYRGAWRKMEVEKQQLTVKGRTAPAEIELHYTVHGPVIHEDLLRRRAYALRWVGSEPGAAGYLAGLALAQAKNWAEFSKAVARYKVPSENIVYADRSGNIGNYVTFALSAKYWMIHHKVALARRELRPDFTATVGYMNRGSLPLMWQASVGVSVPIWSKTKQRRGLDEMGLLADAARASESSVRSRLLAATEARRIALARLHDEIRLDQ